jgi:protein SCO1
MIASRNILASALLACSMLTALSANVVRADSATAAPSAPTVGSDDFIPPPPPTYKANGVTVDEKLGQQLPYDARFRDQTGAVVTLGEVLSASDIPTILTFNYSDCPMLCSLQLNGLTAALPSVATPQPLTASQAAMISATDAAKPMAFALGKQFRLVTIVLEPRQSQAKTVATLEKYIARLPQELQANARKGWTFLSAEFPEGSDADASIHRVADAVGFRYTYIKERAEWAHPAALIFVSTQGKVTRYVYGIEFADNIVRESVLGAGMNNPATAVGFMNRCYHFDPDANNYSRAGVIALRVGAVVLIVVMLSAFGVWTLLRRSKNQRVWREPGVMRS